MDDLTALALRAARGDRIALGAFIRQTQADVWRTCRHLGPRDAADDLTQDTFVRAFKALSGFRAESSARTWIIGIARNVAMDAWRSEQRRTRLRDAVRNTADLSTAPDHASELDDVFAILDPEQAVAFHLTQVLGFSYAQAAEASGCQIGTIRSRVSRARQTLIAALTHDARLRG